MTEITGQAGNFPSFYYRPYACTFEWQSPRKSPTMGAEAPLVGTHLQYLVVGTDRIYDSQ